MTEPLETYRAVIDYKGVHAEFEVLGYGDKWCRTRAISHFFYLHPDLYEHDAGLTFRQRAEKVMVDGLTITLTPV